MRVLFLVPLLLVACKSDDGGTDTGSTSADFDPYEGLEANPNCEDFDGTPVAGATGYFVGDFTIDGNVIEGVEDWVLFANQAWTTANDAGSDCTMRWDVFGTISEADGCVGCSHEIAIDATFNADASDCTQNFETSEGTDYTVTYYVQARSDGSARWEFTSGTLLGDGILTDGAAAYVSESQCNWF